MGKTKATIGYWRSVQGYPMIRPAGTRIRTAISFVLAWASLGAAAHPQGAESGSTRPVQVASLAQGVRFDEYEVKAAFTYRFASFVVWPSSQRDSKILRIGIVGKNPFGSRFERVEGTTIGRRVVEFKYWSGHVDYDVLKTSHVLFISRSERNQLAEILAALGHHPILTVGDIDEFIDKGGMIGFVNRPNGKIGFEINVRAANAAGLGFRSMLQRIAVRILDNTRARGSVP